MFDHDAAVKGNAAFGELQPDWSQASNLERNFPLGWGENAPDWLDPAMDHP